MVGTDERAADARSKAEALHDRRYFVLDPERWAAFQAARTRQRVRIGV